LIKKDGEKNQNNWIPSSGSKGVLHEHKLVMLPLLLSIQVHR